MKKETIILIGLGAVALYFVMQKRRRGAVFVESPEKISEEEFGTPTMEEQESQPITEKARKVIDVVKNVFKGSPERKQARKEARIKRKAARQEKRTTRKTKRQEARIRRKKVGEISIMY